MKNTILICGYGPGISHAVAHRFGKAGHPVAAQRKATHTLAPRDIHVGEVVVNGFVEGTPGGIGKSDTVAPADIAEQFWELHAARQMHSVMVGGAVPVSETGFYG